MWKYSGGVRYYGTWNPKQASFRTHEQKLRELHLGYGGTHSSWCRVLGVLHGLSALEVATSYSIWQEWL